MNAEQSFENPFYPGLFIRLFHLSLFIVIFFLYITDRFLSIHIVFGYIAFFLVLLRIIWGILGKSARLNEYPIGFRETYKYFKELIDWNMAEYSGINPASAWMAILFFIVITLLTVTGIITYAINHYEGIWVGVFSSLDNSTSLMIKKLHFFLSGLLMVLVAVHVCGAVMACIRYRRNIIKPMWLGKN